MPVVVPVVVVVVGGWWLWLVVGGWWLASGGAIALGHPTGASGSRIMGHLAHELQRTGGRYAIGSACIGGGQGIALLLENVH